MANSNVELIGTVEAKPQVLTLADGGTVELHTFEAQIKGWNGSTPMVTGPSAAAVWMAQETQDR